MRCPLCPCSCVSLPLLLVPLLLLPGCADETGRPGKSRPDPEDTAPARDAGGADDLGPAADTGPTADDTGPPADLGPEDQEDQGEPGDGQAGDILPQPDGAGIDGGAPDTGLPPSGHCGPCTTDADCDLFLSCATGDDGERFCTSTCLGPARCPAGYECRARPGGPSLCFPYNGCDDPCLKLACPAGEFCSPRTGTCRTPREGLCEPCARDEECGSPADLCMGNPYTGESFCTMRCAGQRDCPDGYLCLILLDGNAQCYPSLATCHDPCVDARCPEGSYCVPAAGGRCMTPDQVVCAGPCMTAQQCGAAENMCISFPDQPAHCGRPCSNGRCETDEDCGAQGLRCEYGMCSGCQADEQCPPQTVCQWERCYSDCPEGTFCADVVDQAGNVVSSQCAPSDMECESDHLGEPCGADHPGACGGMNSECTDPVHAGVCTRRCSWDSDCPTDWRDCRQVGPSTSLCFPEPRRGPDRCGLPDGAVNELGVGQHCTGAPGECPEGMSCWFSGEFEQTRQLCTRPCSGAGAPPEECGSGASCVFMAGAQSWYCLPEECRCLEALGPGQRHLLREAIGPFIYPCSLGQSDRELGLAPAEIRDINLVRRSQQLGLRHAAAALATARAQQDAVDAALAGAAPLGDAMRAAAAALDLQVAAEPEPLAVPEEEPLVAGLAALFTAGGLEPDLPALRDAVAPLPAALQEEVAPLLFAIARAAELREQALLALQDTADPEGYARVMYEIATALLALRRDELSRPLTADLLLGFLDHGLGYAELVEAGLVLAAAVDGLDRQRLAGLAGFSFGLDTPLGWVILADAGDQQHDPQLPQYRGPIALLLDTGGNDTYRVPAGANAGPEQPAALCIDLGGDDQYLYRVQDDPHDAGLLPSDGGGRLPVEEFQGDDLPGPFSLSEVARQGAGRLGVGILADYGGGSDRYRSLRFSQGAGAMGVGALLDDGGDDVYEAEAFAQGAATFGIGLLLDLGGRDSYRTWTLAQGMGGPMGLGLLADAAGDDSYLAEPGIPADGQGGEGAAPLYPTADDPGRANASRSQGAGVGYRHPEEGSRLHLAGGIGLLFDREGADSYQADTQAQGMGWWWGAGVLADRQGDDQYDLRGVGQACGAFFGLGLLVEGDGADRYDLRAVQPPLYAVLGTASDWGVALLLERGGNDQYAGPAASLGVGLANGIGILLERGGDDVYQASDLLTLGHAAAADDVDSVRRNGRTLGIFVDAGGSDVYQREDLPGPQPPPISLPGSDRRWEQSTNQDVFWEQGRGIDGEGWCGVP